MAGSIVRAPNDELNMLIAINTPKYCRGTISEKTRTRNPAETEMTLMTIALPLTITASSMA